MKKNKATIQYVLGFYFLCSLIQAPLFSENQNPPQTISRAEKAFYLDSAKSLLNIIEVQIKKKEKFFVSLSKHIDDPTWKYDLMDEPQSGHLATLGYGDYCQVSFFMNFNDFPSHFRVQRFENLGMILGYSHTLSGKEEQIFSLIIKDITDQLKVTEGYVDSLDVFLHVSKDKCNQFDTVDMSISIQNNSDKNLFIFEPLIDRYSVWVVADVDGEFLQTESPETIKSKRKMKLNPQEISTVTFSKVMTMPGEVDLIAVFSGFRRGAFSDLFARFSPTVTIDVQPAPEKERMYLKRYHGIEAKLVLQSTEFFLSESLPAKIEFINVSPETRVVNYFYTNEGDIPVLGFLEAKGNDAIHIQSKVEKDKKWEVSIVPSGTANIKKKVLKFHQKFTVDVDLARYMPELSPGEYEMKIAFGNGSIQTNSVDIHIAPLD